MRRRGQLTIQRFSQVKDGTELTTSTTDHVLEKQAAVVKLATITSQDAAVLVVQEDGTVTVCEESSNGVAARLLLVDDSSSVRILSAQCLTTSEARTSVLKSRQDLASGLSDDTIIIVAAYTKQGSVDLHVGVWSLRPHAGLSDNETALTPILSHNMGQQHLHGSPKKSAIHLVGQSNLEIHATNTVMSFDITTIVPQKRSERKHLVPDQISNLELSGEITLYLTANEVLACNRSFGSVLATADLGKSGLKRKRDNEGAARISLVAYFSQMKRVLASNGSQLLSIDLHSTDKLHDPLRRGSTLAGNILRGTDKRSSRRPPLEHKYFTGKIRQPVAVQNWSLISKELDTLAEKNDATGFEEAFKKTFDLKKSRDLDSSKMPEDKVDYLLSKIFVLNQASTGTSSGLNFALLPQDLVRWCINAGFLEEYRVTQALRVSHNSIRPGTIFRALLGAGLPLVEHYIQRSPFLQPDALSQITNILTHKRLDELQVAAQNTITDDNNVMEDLAIPHSSGDDSITSWPVTQCLSSALRRWSYTAQSTISAGLRVWDRTSILGLIQFLRQQMFLGGYSRVLGQHDYPSPPPSVHEGDDDNMDATARLPLGSIVVLLNGCIDAIGPTGILGTDDHEDFIQKMVPQLLSEISNACQAVEDSTFLQGLVRETLRYAESVEIQPFEVRSKVERKIKNGDMRKGEIVTLYAEPETPDGGEIAGSALPLSMKAEEDIDKYKARKGGQAHRRSAREIGMLKDRLKSPYSFERLVL